MARQRVYAVSEPTPLTHFKLPEGTEIFLKREDRGPIHAYKWRGAANRMALLTPEERARGVVTASAGNHAQGVALAARHFGTHARIVMPLTSPRSKQDAVRELGGDAVEVILDSDTYDGSVAAAKALQAETGAVYVHAFDDLTVMGGQGTLADELVLSGAGPFDVAYLQIGGGGLAAGVACWLKAYFPKIEIVGVEGVDQAKMAAAVAAGHPVDLDYLDLFCDGTAVRRAGELTFPLCRDLIDRFTTVTNAEVCGAIQFLWDRERALPEPAGAMGLAAILRDAETLRGKKVVAILCGANVDFGQLAWIARHAGTGGTRRHHLRVRLPERAGALSGFLEKHLPTINIVEFQYGKTHPTEAWPVFGIQATDAGFAAILAACAADEVTAQEVTSDEDVEFGCIPFRADLLENPMFIQLEFHERRGALREFLRRFSPLANLGYFNYAYSGERVGRALLGFEFASSQAQAEFRKALEAPDAPLRSWREVEPAVLQRLLSR